MKYRVLKTINHEPAGKRGKQWDPGATLSEADLPAETLAWLLQDGAIAEAPGKADPAPAPASEKKE